MHVKTRLHVLEQIIWSCAFAYLHTKNEQHNCTSGSIVSLLSCLGKARLDTLCPELCQFWKDDGVVRLECA